MLLLHLLDGDGNLSTPLTVHEHFNNALAIASTPPPPSHQASQDATPYRILMPAAFKVISGCVAEHHNVPQGAGWVAASLHLTKNSTGTRSKFNASLTRRSPRRRGERTRHVVGKRRRSVVDSTFLVFTCLRLPFSPESLKYQNSNGRHKSINAVGRSGVVT